MYARDSQMELFSAKPVLHCQLAQPISSLPSGQLGSVAATALFLQTYFSFMSGVAAFPSPLIPALCNLPLFPFSAFHVALPLNLLLFPLSHSNLTHMWHLCSFSAPDPMGRAQLGDEDTLTVVPTCGFLRPHGVEVHLILSPCSGNLQTSKVSLIVHKTHSTPSVQTGISVSLQTSPISSSSCYTWWTSKPPSELGHLCPAAGPMHTTTTCRSLVCPARGPASPQPCLQMPALGLVLNCRFSLCSLYNSSAHIQSGGSALRPGSSARAGRTSSESL